MHLNFIDIFMNDYLSILKEDLSGLRKKSSIGIKGAVLSIWLLHPIKNIDKKIILNLNINLS